ncbi:hypothetical protein TNCV_1857271 [Trichonephila clavipes]|nr:hypothetical protein TNCV_1857271 [Trichonephila clavipes]
MSSAVSVPKITIKRDNKRGCTPDHNALLRAYGDCDNKGRIFTLPQTSLDTYAFTIRSQLEMGLTTRDFMSPV